jgi:2,3,4,5-tetrahydropyridine-2-carboxylate N-succinyltransferase
LTIEELRTAIEDLATSAEPPPSRAKPVIEALLEALEDGRVRAAEPGPAGWQVNRWVKLGIVLAFRVGSNRSGGLPPWFHFRDRDTLPTWSPEGCPRDVRLVPGGTTVRRGAYLADGVVVMPPAYVNVGAFVDEGSMVDSHALVGSCAQVGRRVHLSAAAQVGGVLEPVGARPVILEDEVFVGGGAGVYEGTQVGHGAVIAPGVILTRSVPVYDLAREEILRAGPEIPLVIPERAVVVPGARPAAGEFGQAHGLQIQTPVIVKYRDSTTDVALALEDALR